MPESTVTAASPAKTADAAHSHLGWSVFRNTAAQVIGRNFSALCRLLVGALIVRSYGREMFGKYALVLGISTLAEWVLDFGTSDIFVREICREPERRRKLLNTLVAAKAVQIPVAAAVLMIVLLAMRYPADIVHAGMAAAGALVFFGGVLIYRVIFRADLTMECEIGAEVLSVLVMLPLIAEVARHHGGLTALFGVFLISRAVFFALCVLFGRSAWLPSVPRFEWHEIRWAFGAAGALGAAGFLMVLCDTLDILLLSRFATISDLGLYSGAQKLVWPVLIALSSVGWTLYSVTAVYWPRDPAGFAQACQRGVETALTVAGLVLCAVLAGAEFFLHLLGPDLVPGALAMRILAGAVFMKTISLTLGPILPVVHGQNQALRIVVLLVVLKATVISFMAWRFGYIGVAWGDLLLEFFFAMIAVTLLQRLSGWKLQWKMPIRIALISLLSGAAAWAVVPNAFAAACVAGAMYCGLAFATGIVRTADIKWLIANKLNRGAAEPVPESAGGIP